MSLSPRRFSEWRRERATYRLAEADQHLVDDLKGYRTPVQVCPRGCEYSELARRDLLSRTGWSGWASIHAVFTFETTNCPRCGSRLTRRCARCDNQIYAPVVERCQFCGLPQPWASERRGGLERASIQYWRSGDEVPQDQSANVPALPLYAADGVDVWAIEGDIAQLQVDAVVSNDDVDGQMWAQVARAIRNGAGEGVERLAQEGKPFRLGQAWTTSPGALEHLKAIIHVASMNRRGQSTVETVKDSLRAAILLAVEKRFGSLGIGAIGSGPASIPPAVWYRTFADVVVDQFRLQRGPEEPTLSIVLVLFEPVDFHADVEDLREAFATSWEKNGRPSHAKLERPQHGAAMSPY